MLSKTPPLVKPLQLIPYTNYSCTVGSGMLTFQIFHYLHDGRQIPSTCLKQRITVICGHSYSRIHSTKNVLCPFFLTPHFTALLSDKGTWKLMILVNFLVIKLRHYLMLDLAAVTWSTLPFAYTVYIPRFINCHVQTRQFAVRLIWTAFKVKQLNFSPPTKHYKLIK